MAASFLGKLLVKIEGDNSDLDKSVKKSEGSVKKFSKFAVAAYAAVGVAIIALSKQAVKAFKIQEQAEAKLNATIKSTGSAAGLTARELTDMASALQDVTKFGDEAIIGAESLLLTFKSIGGDIFPRALESILDVSEAMGQGLKESTVQLGKALNDPIQGLTAMRRVGIQFSDSQEKTIKSMVAMNDLAGAQNIILEELESQFGGVARAAADTATGSIDQLGNSIGDLNEQIGQSIAEGLQPMAKATTSIVDSLVDWIKKNREVNNFLKEFGEGNENSAAEVDTLASSLETLQERLAQASASGRADTTNLEAQISALQILIGQKQRAAALDAQFAGAKAANDKRETERIAKEKEILEFTTARQEAQVKLAVEFDKIDELGKLGLVNVEVEKRNALQSTLNDLIEFGFTAEGAGIANILGFAKDRNVLLENETDLLEGLTFDWEIFDGVVTDGLKGQQAEVKKLEVDWESLTENGLGTFASTFKMMGEEGVTVWDTLKQAGKNAISSFLQGLAQQAIVQASIEAAAGTAALAGILTAPLAPGHFAAAAGYTAGAAAAFAASGLVQNLAEGGVLAPATGGVPAVMAEAGVPEMAMPLNSVATDPFADKIASRINSSTTNNTQNFNSMFSLNDENKMREAARRLWPFMRDEELRRGITV